MLPMKEYLFDPDPDIGGAVIPIVGMPGSGKTVGLTQIALRNFKNDNVVMWRGTKQAQWIHLLANDVELTLWNHEEIKDFEAYISAANPGDPIEKVDLEEHGVVIKEWSDAKQLIEDLDTDRINVVNVPGMEENNKKDLYFFRYMWLEIIKAVVSRKWLRYITMIVDEIGDLFPCQQQLRKPFYKLVAEMLPMHLAQLRKQNCFLYGAAHSTHDVHYFFWKIKANSIMYMSGAVVKEQVSPSIDQSFVSNMKRGEYAMPPKHDGKFRLPPMADSLDWIPDENKRELRLDWKCDTPDLAGIEKGDDGEEDQKSESEIKKEIAKQMYESDNLDLSQQDIAVGLDVSQAFVSNAVRGVS